MIYYSYFTFGGSGLLAEKLGVEDPYALSASEIVERVLAAGHKADIDQPQTERYPIPGHTETVLNGDLAFIVTVSRDDQTIDVQEMRSKAYPRSKRGRTLVFVAEGASEEELARGLAAAQRVFDEAGVSAWECAVADFEREGREMETQGLEDPATPRGHELANLWHEAYDAGRVACCAGWTGYPVCDLKLVEAD